MSQNSRNQGFSYFFRWMTEGSGSGPIMMDPDLAPGGPKTYGTVEEGNTEPGG